MIALGVLAAGNGPGFRAVLDACANGELDAVVAALAAERKCPAITRAEESRIPIVFQPWGPYKVAGKLRETYDRDLAARLLMHGVEFVLLDGWERALSSGIEAMYAGRILDLGLRGTMELPLAERERVVGIVREAARLRRA
jgi:folate-dependent phosphoribosylglycinamide formyltransferase PurN